MRFTLSTIGLLAVALLTSTVMSATAAAVEGESITLSPVSKPYTLDAGATTKDSFTVINDGTTAYDFIVYTAPYSVANHSYEPNYSALKANTDAYTWIQFDKTRWHLEPNQRVKVPYVVRVPKDATPGGHYGVLFAETQPEKDGHTQVVRNKRVGSIIYATANGDYKTEGRSLGTSIDWLQFAAPLLAMTRVENSGNVDFKMRETFRVADVFGNTKYEHTAEHVILPKTNRDLELVWQHSPWFGLYKVSVTTNILGKTTSTEALVLMAPKWFLLVLIAAIVAGSYVAIRSRKRA